HGLYQGPPAPESYVPMSHKRYSVFSFSPLDLGSVRPPRLLVGETVELARGHCTCRLGGSMSGSPRGSSVCPSFGPYVCAILVSPYPCNVCPWLLFQKRQDDGV